MSKMKQVQWDSDAVHKIIDDHSEEFDDYVKNIHKYFDQLKQRKRFAIELDFKGWAAGVPRDEVFDFKKKIEKHGLYCGFSQTYFTVIVSPFPSIVRVMCYVAIPSWENDVIRGLFFGYPIEEINKFMDQWVKKTDTVDGI